MASSFLGGFAGGTIGGAVVRLTLDDDQYKRGLASAQATGKTSTSAMGAALGSFKLLGVAAFAAVAAAAIRFAAASVRVALEAQAAQSELSNSIENSKVVSEAAVPAFNAQAEAIRKLTGADDEAITSSQAFLIQMGLTQTQVSSLTPLIVDLSTKMGVDMNTAAKAVGKAVNGNIGSLSRMGVVVDENAAATDSYTATLNALGVAEGFAAQKAEDEPWRLLASTFEEIQERVGQALLPAIKELSEAMIPLAEDIGPTLELVFLNLANAAVTGSTGVRALTGDVEALTSVDLGLLSTLTSSLPVLKGVSEGLEIADAATQDYTDSSQEALDAARELTGANHSGHPSWVRLKRDINVAGEAMSGFAHKTENELDEWKEAVKDSFDSAVFDLNNFEKNFDFTAKQFIRGSKAMLERAKLLDVAQREIAKKKWINEEYLAFIEESGPGAIVAFTELSGRNQREMQEDWLKTSKLTEGAKGSVDDVTSAINKLGGMKAKAEVVVKYSIDPSGIQPEDLPGLGR